MEKGMASTVQNDDVDWTTAALKSLNINNNNPEGAGSNQSSNAFCPNEGSSGQSSASLGEESSDDAILQKLSKINGAINKMSTEELQEQLKSLGLNTGGIKDILKKRLKNYHRCQRISQSKRLQKADEQTPYDFLVVIDYEATCAKNNDQFVHEIIEFPAVLIDVNHCAVSNVFQRFCKPKVNPLLTEFCTELTGITQEQVNKAKYFREVFAEFQDWLRLHNLGSGHRFAVVTDGPWDMARFLKTQLDLSGLRFPHWAKHWINLRKAYSKYYNQGRVTLNQMLTDLGMEFQGRPHCGLDDARNIAAIAIRLLKDGCVFKFNEHLHQGCPGNASSSPPKKSRSLSHRKGRGPKGVEVPQEGENVEDLLRLAKLQRN